MANDMAHARPVKRRNTLGAVAARRRVCEGVAALGGVLLLGLSAGAMVQEAATPIPDLIARAPDLPPLDLYTLAGRLFAAGRRDEAVVWFYIAQIRSRFRLAAAPDLPPDAEPALYAALDDELGREINGWGFGDVDQALGEIDKALDWDATHANAYTPKTTNAAALDEIRGGLVAMRSSMLAHKDDIRRQRTANGLANR